MYTSNRLYKAHWLLYIVGAEGGGIIVSVNSIAAPPREFMRSTTPRSPSPSALFLRQYNKPAITSAAAMAPTTPPTIAPVLLESEVGSASDEAGAVFPGRGPPVAGQKLDGTKLPGSQQARSS